MFSDHIDFLKYIRKLANTQVYLEIGVQSGTTLFSETGDGLVIGVDPDFHIEIPLRETCHVALFRETSDVFFEKDHFGTVSGQPVDVTFVDGLHWAEFALRDMRNAERLSHRASVILVHDIYPRNAAQAGRTDNPHAWMGDVFKLLPALRRFRPDLQIAAYGDVPYSGMAVIWGLDPKNRVLFDRYDDITRYMDGLDYDRDFATLVEPTFESVGSATFTQMTRDIYRAQRRRSRNGSGWRRHVGLALGR